MRIDFVSDVACPWCAIGLRSLDQALANIGDEIPIEVHFHPFELNPNMPPEGEDTTEHLSRKYGIDAEQIARNRQGLRERGEAVGFTFGDRARIWNTFDAHRLIYWAGSKGPERQHALKLALLEAYHTRGENPGSPDVLLRVAEGLDFDVEEAAEVLRDGLYADEVRASETLWQQRGIHAVPAVVINGRHLISGGQPPEVFERALRELAVDED